MQGSLPLRLLPSYLACLLDLETEEEHCGISYQAHCLTGQYHGKRFVHDSEWLPQVSHKLQAVIATLLERVFEPGFASCNVAFNVLLYLNLQLEFGQNNVHGWHGVPTDNLVPWSADCIVKRIPWKSLGSARLHAWHMVS